MSPQGPLWEPLGRCCTGVLRNHQLELLWSCFCFCMSYFLDSLCHFSHPFPPLLPSLPHSPSFLLFLFILFLLPVASSRPRGRSCGILRPVGSLPRSLWELTWQPAGSGGPCRYMNETTRLGQGRAREGAEPPWASWLPAEPGSAPLPRPGAAHPRVLPRLQHMLPVPVVRRDAHGSQTRLVLLPGGCWAPLVLPGGIRGWLGMVGWMNGWMDATLQHGSWVGIALPPVPLF